MMKDRWFWPIIILLSAIAAGVVAITLPGTVLCLVVMLWFLLLCPGLMVVRYLNLKEEVAVWTLALALSIAIDAIVASIALYAGAWSPPSILYTLITICVIGVIGQFILAQLGPIALPEPLVRYRLRPASLLLPLFLVMLIMGLGASSNIVNLQAATVTPASPQSAQRPVNSTTKATLAPSPPPTVPALDVVIVMDNVDQITTYDPQNERYKAAQLLVNLMPGGDQMGIVGITSNTNPRRMLALQSLQTSSDKALVNNTLSANTFGPVDPTPIAYFTPALQLAGNMLLAGATNHRKLILIFTDALAFSGDQNACNISPDANHNWFCTVQALEQKGISVALVGFTSPGSLATLQPTQQFFLAHGGKVLPVVDTGDLASQLTLDYRNLLSPTLAPPTASFRPA
jgi:hypothetical protein